MRQQLIQLGDDQIRLKPLAADVITMNLYKDRALVLYGRYPKGLEHVIFQATGAAGDARCDMICDLSRRDEETNEGRNELRDAWALQKETAQTYYG